jgi:uncharacterized protein
VRQFGHASARFAPTGGRLDAGSERVNVSVAVVTGSTSGIGAAFAERLAARGYDLVLVARNAQRLDDQAADLARRYGSAVETMAMDLADRGQIRRLEDRLEDASRPVTLLVNNAGMSTGRAFTANDVEDEQYQLDLDVVAVLRLTHAAVTAMAAARGGAVLNISSTSGWVAGGSYSATKAWVTSFSEGIANEVRGRGVRVVAICPGFVRTNFHAAGAMDVSSIPDWMWLQPDQIVDDAFAALRQGRTVTVPTIRFRVLSAFARHAPRPLVTAAYLRLRPKN